MQQRLFIITVVTTSFIAGADWVTSPDFSATELDTSTVRTSGSSRRTLHFGGMFQLSSGGRVTSQDQREAHQLGAIDRGHQRARYVLESTRLV
jgi:hypothetical protein